MIREANLARKNGHLLCLIKYTLASWYHIKYFHINRLATSKQDPVGSKMRPSLTSLTHQNHSCAGKMENILFESLIVSNKGAARPDFPLPFLSSLLQPSFPSPAWASSTDGGTCLGEEPPPGQLTTTKLEIRIIILLELIEMSEKNN